MKKLRKAPPVCFFISLGRLITGKLRFSKRFMGKELKMADGSVFTVFRHITTRKEEGAKKGSVFVVSFKFARLSHRGNKITSILPMLLITGFPGFVTKIYSVNFKNGYWQGIYQWESETALVVYQQSFVFRVMKKRAIETTIQSFHENSVDLNEWIEELNRERG